MGLVGTISSGQANVAAVPDQAFADLVNSPSSASRAALSATYATGALSRGKTARQASLLKGYSIVGDLCRPFNGQTANPYDAGVSQMAIKVHTAVCDASDLVLVYANWKGSSIGVSAAGVAPIYVKAGFGHIVDGDVFPVTFNGGRDREVKIDPGQFAVSDPIAGAKITAGQTFKIGTFARTDIVTATVTTTNGSNSLTALASQVGTFYVGQYIYGTGIPAAATITAVTSTTLTISANATASASGIAVTALGSFPAAHIGYDVDGDRFTNSGTGSTTLTTDRTADSTLVSWGSKNTNTAYGASVILGRTDARAIRVMAAEVDSIGSGAHDNTPAASTATGSAQRLGWVERTWADDGLMLMGVGGAKKNDFIAANSTAAVGALPNQTQRLAAGATGILFETGTNDVADYPGTSVATIQARFIKDWRKLAGERLIPGWQATILPRVTGTFGTDAGQTVTAYETARVQLNDWMRDGAPLNADLTPAAVGATGGTILRAPYLSWSGTNWTTVAGAGAHPLALGGIFEVADSVETARNSGKWKRQWEGTGDTTNTSTSVVNVATTAGGFVNGQVVSGTGIPSNATATLAGATATLSSAATATATGVALAQPYTDDGTHPLPAGHIKITTWLAQIGTSGKTARQIIRESCDVLA